MRDEKWDFVKSILMLLVIYGHICPALTGATYADTWCVGTRITGLFVMPLFFFVSGFFQTRINNKNDVRNKIRKTSLRIALPLFIWGLIMTLPKLSRYWGGIHEKSSMYHAVCMVKPVVYSVLESYWFLTVLLLCIAFGSLMSFILNKYSKIGNIILFISLPLFILSNFDFFHFSFFWFFYGFGILFRLYEKFVIKLLKCKGFNIILMICSIICVLIGASFYPEYTFYKKSNLINDSSLFFIVGRYVLCLITSLCALFGLFILYNKYEKKSIVQYFAGTGRNTLFLYCSHIALLAFVVLPILKVLVADGCILSGMPFVRYYLVSPILAIMFFMTLQKLSELLQKSIIGRVLFLGLPA